jgi:hypothetical protein
MERCSRILAKLTRVFARLNNLSGVEKLAGVPFFKEPV